jgi:hypothetical protein
MRQRWWGTPPTAVSPADSLSPRNNSTIRTIPADCRWPRWHRGRQEGPTAGARRRVRRCLLTRAGPCCGTTMSETTIYLVIAAGPAGPAGTEVGRRGGLLRQGGGCDVVHQHAQDLVAAPAPTGPKERSVGWSVGPFGQLVHN